MNNEDSDNPPVGKAVKMGIKANTVNLFNKKIITRIIPRICLMNTVLMDY